MPLPSPEVIADLVRVAGMDYQPLALDRSSRHIDADGRMHVAVSHLSKATVNPYWGREIPDAERMGLDLDRIYMLLRDPDELRKAAPTNNNIQLLITHIPVTADSPQPDKVVGSTGTDAVFNDPYLDNSLVIWDSDAIAGVNDRSRTELSCGYRYDADMTPGEYKGLRFDGVMRNIVFNHVALVEQGRAGPDVVVGDEMPKGAKMLTSRKALMVRGALAAYVKPLLAADAKIDLNAVVGDVKFGAFDAAAVAERLALAAKGKLKPGADLKPIAVALDAMKDEEDCDGEDEDYIAGEDEDPDDDDAGGEDGRRARDARRAKDETAEEEAERERREQGKDRRRAKDARRARDDDPEDNPGVKLDKKAMDAAITAALDGRDNEFRAIRQAEREVRRVVGDLAEPPKSAADVYKYALDAMGVDLKEVPPSAYRAIFNALPATSEPSREQPLAHDEAEREAFGEAFANVARIRRRG